MVYSLWMWFRVIFVFEGGFFLFLVGVVWVVFMYLCFVWF